MPRANNAIISTNAGTHWRRAHWWSAAVAVGLLLASCANAPPTSQELIDGR